MEGNTQMILVVYFRLQWPDRYMLMNCSILGPAIGDVIKLPYVLTAFEH